MKYKLQVVAVGMAMLIAGGVTTLSKGDVMATDQKSDEQILIDHVHQIFKAYLAKDRDTILATHAKDWTGFMGPSTGIERGIDDYMQHADHSLATFNGTGYKIHDTEVQIHGDFALVFYVATYYYEDADKSAHEFPLRSIDVFRRQDGDWIQSASHISVINTGGKWGEGD